MTKAEVVSKISAKTGVEKTTTLAIVESFMNEVMNSVSENESVFFWEDDENRTLASYQFREIQPGFVEFNCESEGTADVLLFALQKIDSQKMALHFLLAPENWSSDPISLKLAYAQWSKKLRNQLEQVS